MCMCVMCMCGMCMCVMCMCVMCMCVMCMYVMYMCAVMCMCVMYMCVCHGYSICDDGRLGFLLQSQEEPAEGVQNTAGLCPLSPW